MSDLWNRFFGKKPPSLYDTGEQELRREALNYPIQSSGSQDSYGFGATPDGKTITFTTPPTASTWCEECGVSVLKLKAKRTSKGTVYLFDDNEWTIPAFQTVWYCWHCAPPGTIVLTLVQDSTGDVLDSLSFRTDEGWLQPVNESTGEYLYLFEENELSCHECGEPIGEQLCEECYAGEDTEEDV